MMGSRFGQINMPAFGQGREVRRGQGVETTQAQLAEGAGAGPMCGGAGHAGHLTDGAGHAGHLTGGAGHSGHLTGGAGPAFPLHAGVAHAGHQSVNMGPAAGWSARGEPGQGSGRWHQQNLANELESMRETIKVKNETLGNMRKELLEKMLWNTMSTATNQADLMQVERDFRRVELSCKEALLN